MLQFGLTITIASLYFCFLYSKFHIFATLVFRSHPSSAQKLQHYCYSGIQNTLLLCTKAFSYSPLTSKLNTDSLLQLIPPFHDSLTFHCIPTWTKTTHSAHFNLHAFALTLPSIQNTLPTTYPPQQNLHHASDQFQSSTCPSSFSLIH